MALECWKEKDYKGCTLQIRFASQFEPDNEVFKQWAEKAKQAEEKAAGEVEENPYKLRLV